MCPYLSVNVCVHRLPSAGSLIDVSMCLYMDEYLVRAARVRQLLEMLFVFFKDRIALTIGAVEMRGVSKAWNQCIQCIQ